MGDDEKTGYIEIALPSDFGDVTSAKLKSHSLPKDKDNKSDDKKGKTDDKKNDGKKKDDTDKGDSNSLTAVNGTEPKDLTKSQYVEKDDNGKKKMYIGAASFSKSSIKSLDLEYTAKKDGSTATAGSAGNKTTTTASGKDGTDGKDGKDGSKKSSDSKKHLKTKNGARIKDDKLVTEKIPSDSDDEEQSIWSKWWFILILVAIGLLIVGLIIYACNSGGPSV